MPFRVESSSIRLLKKILRALIFIQVQVLWTVERSLLISRQTSRQIEPKKRHRRKWFNGRKKKRRTESKGWWTGGKIIQS